MEHRDSSYSTLEIGHRVIIQGDSPRGHFSLRGEIIFISGHHFRVSCDTRIPANALQAQQELKISLDGESSLLPITTKFIKIAKKGSRTLILSLPEGTFRKNRRAFFRGNIDANVSLLRQDGTIFYGRAINISGGGILIELDPSAEKTLHIDDEFEIEIMFDSSEKVIATSRIVRVDETEQGFNYGVKFTHIPRRDQDKICRMVIVQEFEARRAEIRELSERAPIP